MRILVCGGRNFSDRILVYAALYRIAPHTEPDQHGNTLPFCTIIHGGCSGADRFADEWAVVNFCGLLEYPARWDEFGLSAGPKRNRQMLEEGKPDLVVAFPGGKGTANMVALAEAAGVEVRRPTWENLEGK